MQKRLGAHLSIAGGYEKALLKISEIGGNCLQIFSCSPRGWNFPTLDEHTIKLFKSLREKLQISPVYFHASYLVNLASAERVGQLSCQSLTHELNTASKLGIKGSIVHLGSLKTVEPIIPVQNFDPYENLIVNIKKILEKTPTNTLFMIENAGNNKIGKDLAEIATIIQAVKNDRVRVCLDTCHLYSAGYDISTKEKLNDFLGAFDSLIGLEKLELIHVNDSRDPFSSGRDRHENIGQGSLGLETFRNIMNNKKTKDLPFIIETPGFDDKGPDKKNLDILKSLIYE